MATLGKNQVFEIKNGDGTSFHNLVLRKSAVESIVMSLGDKISGDVYYKDNSLSVTMHEYITYNGVNYMLVNPPTIVREGIVSDNSELKGMTKYSFVFYHPMCLLSNFPFTDVAVTSDETRYLSESKTFSWIGKPADFVAKMNKNLDGTEWIVEISSRFPQDKLNELSDVIPFDNATIADACKTFYDTWGVPYVVDKVAPTEASYATGKRFKLVMGLPSNEIYANATAQQQNTPFVFQMGHGVGLKNNSRTPRNNKIITRISGYGSENNIPYGYPQVRWYGTAGQAFTYGDHAGVYNDVTIEGVHFDKIISYPIYKGILDGEYVELIKHPFTRTHLMPSVYRTTLFNKISFYDAAGEANTDYDPDITLVDYYDAVYSAQYPYPNTINLQAPSYESHEFEDEKPELGEAHIISATPLNNDLTPASSWDDSLDDEGNYKQSYFQMVLPQLSFDLYACASITEEMQINMRSGACLGCTFTVQVDWDDYKRNFYDEDGNFAPNGSQRDLTKYPKSDQGSIALVLQKDNSTFGTLMPNMYQYPQGETSSGAGDGDTFVILGISLPESYIFAAEWRLDADMKSYMLENNVHYFDYPLKFDEDFLFHNENILSQIRPNTIVRFNYAGQTQALFVKQITVKYGDQPLPQYDITLTDNVEVVLNQIGQVAEDVEKLSTLIAILRQSYGKNVWNELAKKLSKTQDDTAAGYITMLKGLQIGNNFASGILGEGGVLRKRAEDGKVELEVDILYARMKAYFDTVEVREYQHTGGNRIASVAGNRICRVEYIKVVDNVETIVDDASEADFFRCYFRASDGEDTVRNNWVVGDLAYCHITSIANGSDNPEEKGLNQKHLWRLVIGRNTEGTLTEDGEAYIDLSNRSSETISSVSYAGYQSGSDTPAAQDDIIQLGNVNDTTRQGAIVEFVTGTDAPSYQIYQGIGQKVGSDASSIYALTSKQQIGFGYNTATGHAYLRVLGDAYIGARDRSTFIEYKQDDGTQQHAPVLNIKANVTFTNVSEMSQFVKDNQNNYDDTAVVAAIGGLESTTESLQRQIDGAIDTWYYDYMPVAESQGAPANRVPLTNVEPYKTWYEADGGGTASEVRTERERHLDDIFYDNSTGYAFRFSLNETTQDFEWVVITDSAVLEALERASKAQATADGKMTIYSVWGAWVKSNVNTLQVGDLFIPTANTTQGGVTYKANKVYKCTADGQAQFQAADYIDDAQAQAKIDAFVSNTYNPDKINLQSQIDGKAETFRQATDPSLDWYVEEGGEVTLDVRANHVGDLWMDISANGGKKTYIYEDNGEGATPRYEWKAQEVPDEVFDEIDGKSTIFGNAIATPPTNYKKNDMWLLPAAATINGVSYKAGDVLSASQDSATYSATHWSKKVRYTDDSAFNSYIDEMLNGSHTSGSASIVAAATQRAIMSALGGSTIIAGGLMLTSMIALRQNTGTAENPQYTTWAGISGMYDNTLNEQDEYVGVKGHGIAAWYGGAKVDLEDKSNYWTEEQIAAWEALTDEQKAESPLAAKSLFRMDGSGYLATANISWNDRGQITIKNITTLSDSQNTNLLNELATFNSAFHFTTGGQGGTTILSIDPQVQFSSLHIGGSTDDYLAATRKWVGDNYISKTWFNNILKVHYKATAGGADTILSPNNSLPSGAVDVSLESVFSFWTNYAISALGQGVDGSHAIGSLDDLSDVELTSPAVDQILKFDGTHWVNAAAPQTYVLPMATTSALGGIIVSNALGSQVTLTSGAGTTANRYYGVQIDSVGQAFVNIPWTDTTYTLAGLMGSSAIGGATQPIYWNGSAFANTTYTLGKSVPSDALFTDTTYSAGTGLSLSGTTFSIKQLGTGAWFGGAVYVESDGVMETGRYIDFHPTSASTLDYNVRLDAGTGTTPRIFTFADTAGTLLSSGNSSVSLSGSTLTVKINGTSQSLTNTWRGIQNNLTSSSTTDSLSAYQGYLLANGSARDNTKLPLAGGTLTGTLTARDVVVQSDYSLKIGGIYLTYDSNNNALRVSANADGTGAANFYAQGGIAALGSTGSGGGGGQGDVTWELLKQTAASGRWIDSSYISGTLANYLPLSGGTMTGILTLWGSQYNAYNTGYGALNLNNSDITGVNSILTADLSDSWSESIGFKRTNGNYDTFRAADGTFYFGINNGASEYTAVHSGNIGSQSVSYATTAGKTTKLHDYYNLVRPASADIQIGDGGVRYFVATSSMTTSKPPMGDASIIHCSWDNNGGWEKQLALGHSDHTHIQLRAQSSGTWGDWVTILDSTNSSVSKSGDTLTVKINDITQSIANTWRGIQNNLTSTSTTDSLSAAQGKALNEKFANYVLLSSTEQTIASTIGTMAKGVIEFYRSSGNHFCMIGFANKDNNGNKRTLGFIGFRSGDAGQIAYQDASGNTYKIWHEGNDGASSGLDADLLDGQHGSYYAAASSLSNYLPLAGGTMTGTLYLNTGVSIADVTGNALLAYHPASWTGVSNTQWGVGTVDSVGVIRTSASALKHFRNGDGTYDIIDSKGGQTIASSLTIGANNNDYLQIGAIKIVYDSSNTALKVIKSDGTAANFYATGGIAALGSTGSGGGGGGQGDVTWDLLKSSDTRQINISHLAGDANYAGVMSILTGYTTSGQNYKIQEDANHHLYVNVPWSNTTYTASSGVGLSGTNFYNSGVRAATINGDYLRVNTNGTNADLTIPYATKASQDNDGTAFKGYYLRKVSVPNNAENDFNTFENMTLTGRGDPTTGASLSHAPWSGAGPAGGYGVLTYLWSGYGIQMAWGYGSNRIYIRNKYYESGAVWSDLWSTVALTSDIPTNNNQLINGAGYVTSSGVTSVATGTGLTGGTITSSGTISINSTYQTYISHGESAYNSLSSYLLLSGGTMTGTLTTPKIRINTLHSSASKAGGIYYYNGTTDYLLIGQGSSNLWIGANETSGTHHIGSTYISAGEGSAYISRLVSGTRTNYEIIDASNIGSQSVSYATSANYATSSGYTKKLANYYDSRPASADLLLGDGSVRYFEATSSMTTNKPPFDNDSSILHLSWDNTGGYEKQIAVSHGTSPHMMIRAQASGTWTNWVTMLDSTNYSDYALPKSGGTLTGNITLPYGLYVQNNTYGLNCSNSDIINVNGVFTADLADSYAEGYCFKRSNGNYDSIRAADGVFYFGSNNGTEKVLIKPDTDGVGNGAVIIDGTYKFGLLMGSGLVNRGIYSFKDSSWMLYFDATNTILNYGNVGIGTTSPSYKLHVAGTGYFSDDLSFANTKGINMLNSASAAKSVMYMSSGNVLVIGSGTSESSYSTYLRGYNVYLKFGTTGATGLILNSSGNVGIGTTSPSVKLHVDGDIYATGGVTALVATSSDIRKKNVVSYDSPLTLNQIADAPTIKFTWKDNVQLGEQVGTIAQYWQKVLPQTIRTEKDDTLSLQYGVAALVAAITTARKVVEHEARIKALEKECADWKQAYSFLEKAYNELKHKIA